jgi:hypothetical protein
MTADEIIEKVVDYPDSTTMLVTVQDTGLGFTVNDLKTLANHAKAGVIAADALEHYADSHSWNNEGSPYISRNRSFGYKVAREALQAISRIKEGRDGS